MSVGKGKDYSQFYKGTEMIQNSGKGGLMLKEDTLLRTARAR